MIDFNFPVNIPNGDTGEVLLIERKDGKEDKRPKKATQELYKLLSNQDLKLNLILQGNVNDTD